MADDWLVRTVPAQPMVIKPASIHLVSGHDQAANSVVGSDPACLWLAPRRALVVAFDHAVTPDGEFVSDVTDGQTVFALANPDDIIAMATTLDPALLAPGLCAQTLFAGVKALLWRRGDMMLVHVDRPLGNYLATWLAKAGSALQGHPSS
jgi:sarcosine oxidase gamma subunit